MTTSEFITSTQTAKKLGLQTQTLRVWRLLGKGPRYTRLGDNPQGRVVYRCSEVERWIENHTYASTADEAIQAVA